ncbi:GNAT family N-acetyltransferase [Paenibacillus piri]|uniref:GNAT family N-acetyltransferase n=1 Tax=Paenibacillus piri TaxID=2547395 RepID=A0A4V2ZU15_9BACL|nr:GNAT family N-acetyltransferase [Paenibacillus piri]TDF99194.1 GNAT family N-acetyltransferase [Paenibacillus piri]
MDIHRISHDHVEEIHKLMLDVVSRLPSGALFAMDDEDYLHDLLKRKGEIYGAFDNGKLVAYTVLALPGIGSGNLGREFGVPEEELSRVGVFDATIVHESVRGRGLQRFFIDLRERRAKTLGCLHLYSTVHPDNEASRRNLEAARFVLQFTRQMYGGHPRHCYTKRLQ